MLKIEKPRIGHSTTKESENFEPLRGFVSASCIFRHAMVIPVHTKSAFWVKMYLSTSFPDPPSFHNKFSVPSKWDLFQVNFLGIRDSQNCPVYRQRLSFQGIPIRRVLYTVYRKTNCTCIIFTCTCKCSLKYVN